MISAAAFVRFSTKPKLEKKSVVRVVPPVHFCVPLEYISNGGKQQEECVPAQSPKGIQPTLSQSPPQQCEAGKGWGHLGS